MMFHPTLLTFLLSQPEVEVCPASQQYDHRTIRFSPKTEAVFSATLKSMLVVVMRVPLSRELCLCELTISGRGMCRSLQSTWRMTDLELRPGANCEKDLTTSHFLRS